MSGALCVYCLVEDLELLDFLLLLLTLFCLDLLSIVWAALDMVLTLINPGNRVKKLMEWSYTLQLIAEFE